MLQPTTISANGTSAVLPNRTSNALCLMINVSAVPTGGSPTLDVYLQHSADQGTTWQDLVHFPQAAASAVISFASVSGYVTGGATCAAHADASLAANTVVQGPYGDQLKLKWVFVAGNSGTYTLSAKMVEKL